MGTPAPSVDTHALSAATMDMLRVVANYLDGCVRGGRTSDLSLDGTLTDAQRQQLWDLGASLDPKAVRARSVGVEWPDFIEAISELIMRSVIVRRNPSAFDPIEAVRVNNGVLTVSMRLRRGDLAGARDAFRQFFAAPVAAPSDQPKAQPPVPAVASLEDGVLDGVTGDNLGRNPLDKMESPFRLAEPPAFGTDAFTYWQRWIQSYHLLGQAQALWLQTTSPPFSPVQRREAHIEYLTVAQAAERWRGRYYVETKRSPPSKAEVAREATTGTVIVEVSAPNGNPPPPGAEVGWRQGDSEWRFVKVPANGRVVLDHLPEGRTEVLTRAPAHQTATRTVTVNRTIGEMFYVVLKPTR